MGVTTKYTSHSTMLRSSLEVKGTATLPSERQKLALEGLIPYPVESMEIQLKRCYAQFLQCGSPLQKHLYLKGLKQRNEILFCRLTQQHMIEMLPILYTPTVGDACLQYSLHFREPEGLHITYEDRNNINRLLDNWESHHNLEETGGVAIIVVTDGSRILGLGDLGFNGLGISVGKLSLYVLAGGFDPKVTLPVVLDVGTNNKELLNDEFYLGYRSPRLSTEKVLELAEHFMNAVKSKWPSALVQFEDFANTHAFDLLNNFRYKQLCFNDDIQGTGVVIAAGILNAIRLASLEKDIKNLKLLFVGAGASAIGVADQTVLALQSKYPELTIDFCKSNIIYMVDSKGLISIERINDLTKFKKPYARNNLSSVPSNNLLDIVNFVKPHAIIGLTAKPNTFTDDVLRTMAKLNSRPIIFALSNPTNFAECSFQRAFTCSEGRCIFASGSPFPPCLGPGGSTVKASQGNNLYAFPGIGFGSWLCQATQISDKMMTSATLALADMVSEQELKEKETLYPSLEIIDSVSAHVATAVIRTACEEGLLKDEGKLINGKEIPKSNEELEQIVRNAQFKAEYN